MFTTCLTFSSNKITELVLPVFVFLFCFFCFVFFIFHTAPFSYKVLRGHFFKIIIPSKFPKILLFTNVVRTCEITKVNLMMIQYPKARLLATLQISIFKEKKLKIFQ